MRKSLTRADRLRRRADFDNVFANGRRVQGEGARMVFEANGLLRNRFAVTPTRIYETAVKRNRARRICKEAYRHLKHRLDTGYDVVFVIYPGSDSFDARNNQLDDLFSRAGIRRKYG